MQFHRQLYVFIFFRGRREGINIILIKKKIKYDYLQDQNNPLI